MTLSQAEYVGVRVAFIWAGLYASGEPHALLDTTLWLYRYDRDQWDDDAAASRIGGSE